MQRILLLLALASATAFGQVQNLRITEVDPFADQVEITNVGPAFTTVANRPFCHRFNYASSIPAGTSFAAGQRRVFTVSGLNNFDSDLWLYTSGPFGSGANIVHGLKYGSIASVGRTGLAASVGLWPSGAAFVPAPAFGQSIAFDGFGDSNLDWYLDDTPTLGADDVEVFGTVTGGIAFPGGTDDFEGLALGDTANALVAWGGVGFETTPGSFDVRVVNDVNGAGAPLPAPGSTRWLRVRDQEESATANRFYSNFIETGGPTLNYSMTYRINPLELPAAGLPVRPAAIIQHATTTGVTNAFGVDFDANQARLVVFPNGGPATTFTLGALPTGSWTEVTIDVDLDAGFVTAMLSTGTSASVPIGLAGNVDPTRLRFCYRGEGVGNVATVLFDDVDISFVPPAPAAFPGTGEDLVFRTSVGTGVAGLADDNDFLPVVGNDLLTLQLDSPNGTFDFTPPTIIGQIFATGTPLPSPDGFPSIHVNPNVGNGPFVLIDGPSAFGSFLLPPEGFTLSLAVPPNMAGTSVRLQGFSVTPSLSNNGIFASTNAVELQFN